MKCVELNSTLLDRLPQNVLKYSVFSISISQVTDPPLPRLAITEGEKYNGLS